MLRRNEDNIIRATNSTEYTMLNELKRVMDGMWWDRTMIENTGFQRVNQTQICSWSDWGVVDGKFGWMGGWCLDGLLASFHQKESYRLCEASQAQGRSIMIHLFLWFM